MGANQRKQVVEKYKYCINCLAHKHSQSGCFSNTGCHICRRSHHTLLHQESIKRESEAVRVVTSSALPPQTITVLPTALVKIVHDRRLYQVRALIDTGCAVSRVIKSTLTKIGIKTIHVEDTLMCQLTIRANSDPKARFSANFRVDNRMSMKTPSHSLPSTFKDKFINLILADPAFYESAPISMVLGSDVYPKIILGGVMPNHEGIPMAQNSILGWLVSGICSP